uniref:Glycosyltransferase n=1 Tax=uncultured organism TaxID=155900 RepID=A0A8K1X8I1_9ZZZZ|nr:glycosyltransferase [uncultured organism]
MMTEQTKRISILHTESSTGWGGQEIRILTEAAGMIARGHKVVLVTPPEAQIAPAALKRGIPTVTLPIGRKNFKGFMAMRQYLKQHGREFDVINTHSSTDSWLVAANCATLCGMPPLVRTRHVSSPVNTKASTRWLYQTATTHVVTTGEVLRSTLNQVNGYDLNRMTSVRTGIDLNHYKPLDKTAMRSKLNVADKPTIGILATLRDWKGHDDLIDAFASIKDEFPEWQILVIGDGPRRPDIRKRCQDLNVTDRIHLVGNQDNVPEWLSCLDLFVLPSFGDEGVPQGLMQAMACGVPAISTPIGAIGEALQHALTGLMTPPRDVPRLARNLKILMQDAAMRAEYGRASLKYASENFGIDIMLDRMEQAFRQAIAEPSGK